jgi:penicillin-binding protein 1A
MMTERINAELITGMLKNAVEKGTAASLGYRFGLTNELAGKTGTTQNHSDGWFIGYSPEYTAGVWVGGELPHIAFRSLAYGQGAYTALPIWAYFFREMYSDSRFSGQKAHSFLLSQEALRKLDCEDYYETRPFRIFNQDPVKFFRELFRKKKRRN